MWVVGDLFQQFATKYLGIGRGIPLSNTNQFWGLAWGALVFGELASANRAHLALVLGGSVLMILGALAISTRRSPRPSRRLVSAVVVATQPAHRAAACRTRRAKILGRPPRKSPPRRTSLLLVYPPELGSDPVVSRSRTPDDPSFSRPARA